MSARPWYQSRTIWGGIVGIIAAIAGLFGAAIDQPAMTDALMALGSLGGALVTIYGRLNDAIKPIKRENPES